MGDTNRKTIDFSGALLLMRDGVPVKRLAWEKKPVTKRKYKMKIAADGNTFDTWFLNYVSNRAVLQPEDLLAKDWIDVEQ